MEDITLWDIFIGNGYCRRRRNHHHRLLVLCFAPFHRCFTYSFRLYLSNKENILFGHEDKNRLYLLFFALFPLCRFFFVFFVCRRVAWVYSAQLCRTCIIYHDAELLMPLVLVKYCNVPLKRQFLWLVSHLNCFTPMLPHTHMHSRIKSSWNRFVVARCLRKHTIQDKIIQRFLSKTFHEKRKEKLECFVGCLNRNMPKAHHTWKYTRDGLLLLLCCFISLSVSLTLILSYKHFHSLAFFCI